MYDIIDKNSNPPFTELFAIKKKKSWDSIGLEIDQQDITISLNDIIKLWFLWYIKQKKIKRCSKMREKIKNIWVRG